MHNDSAGRPGAPLRRVSDRWFRTPTEIIERLICGHQISWELIDGAYQASRSERRACRGCRDAAPAEAVDRRPNGSPR